MGGYRPNYRGRITSLAGCDRPTRETQTLPPIAIDLCTLAKHLVRVVFVLFIVQSIDLQQQSYLLVYSLVFYSGFMFMLISQPLQPSSRSMKTYRSPKTTTIMEIIYIQQRVLNQLSITFDHFQQVIYQVSQKLFKLCSVLFIHSSVYIMFVI